MLLAEESLYVIIIIDQLCNAMGSENMFAYLHGDKGYIRLVQCFFYPGLFVQLKEDLPSVEDVYNNMASVKSDLLYQLFQPTERDTLGKIYYYFV